MWDAVLRLHAHRVTHRSLTADKIVICPDGQIKLLDPGGGDIAASDLQLRLDLAQLLAELATLAGPDRAADLAERKLDGAELVGLLPLLQPVVLARSTRMYLRRHKHVLPELRARLLAIDPGDGAGRAAGPAGAGPAAQPDHPGGQHPGRLPAHSELARVNLSTLLRSADPRWMLVALGLSALTYVGAAWELSGFVLERLSFARTVLAQLASSFVTLVTPAAVGGAALNVRYLQRRKIPPAVAAASVGVSQVVAFVLHIVLLVIFVAITGARSHSLRPPTWAYWVHRRAGSGGAHRAGRAPRPTAAPGPAGSGGGPGRAPAGGHGAAAGQAGRGHRRRAAAERELHPLPGRLRAGASAGTSR